MSNRFALPRPGPGRVRAVHSALLLLLIALGCSGPAGEARPGRVLVVGIDGATLRVAGPMLEEGRLPNLARLAREGVSGHLRSLSPLLSPNIWNSIATGKRPGEHGIEGFARIGAEGVPRLLLSTDRRVHAIWNIASAAGLTVGVVNWWNTFPPERVNGVMISDHLFANEVESRKELAGATSPVPEGAMVYPPEWQSRLSQIVADSKTAPRAPPFARLDKLPAWMERRDLLAHWQIQDEVLVRFALLIEQEISPDLLMVLLTGIDRVSHFLWIGMESNEAYPERFHLTDAQRAEVRAALESYYEFTDAEIGRLLERYGSDDLVILLSDHGFEAGLELDYLTGTHVSEAALDGVFFARGEGVTPGPLGPLHVLDVTPSILAWLRLPVGMDMDGRVSGALWAGPVDRTPTHDTAPVERLETGASGAEVPLIEELRALGYVE